ncbi:MAG TPA: NADP-dependent oxidoreductase [Solirubrobacteraceae bacterium]|nr:NADP-dependent oxidoreductase [Solirubrobacteraceae bacterium]
MRAILYKRFGGPEVLELVDVPDPHPSAGQVRVAVRAVGVNPIDWKMRSGMMGGDLPQTTGREAAGVVDAVGEGIEDVGPGDRVFGFVTGAGAAELAVLTDYAPIPASLDFAGAAALPVAVETATRTLDLLGVGQDTILLINGAAGAVGCSAVQLARLRGARVIGTASPNNHEYLRSLGAEPTSYGDGLTDRVREIVPGGVDAALDAAGGGALPALLELAGDPEGVVTIADYAGAHETGVRFSGGMGTERAVHALRDVGPLIESGKFSLPVAETFPLEKIGDAHALSQDGHVRGKLVLLVG